MRSVEFCFVTSRLFRLVVLFAIFVLSVASAEDITSKNWGKDSQGIKLSLREESRQRSVNGTILSYKIIGEGFRRVFLINCGNGFQARSRKSQGKVSFDKHGVLVCSGKPGFCSGDGPDDQSTLRPSRYWEKQRT